MMEYVPFLGLLCSFRCLRGVTARDASSSVGCARISLAFICDVIIDCNDYSPTILLAIIKDLKSYLTMQLSFFWIR